MSQIKYFRDFIFEDHQVSILRQWIFEDEDFADTAKTENLENLYVYGNSRSFVGKANKV